jgi:hypothetical protein
VYLVEENAYRRPADEKLAYRFASQENGEKLHRYWTNACRNCLKADARQARSAGHALRTRGRTRGGAEAARRKCARHAHAARDCRAPVRHHEDAHGRVNRRATRIDRGKLRPAPPLRRQWLHLLVTMNHRRTHIPRRQQQLFRVRSTGSSAKNRNGGSNGGPMV